MRFSIREAEAEAFADKTNYIAGVNYIFVENQGTNFIAYTFQYDPKIKQPINDTKLSVAKASSFNGIVGEIHEFEQNYGTSRGILIKNDAGQFQFIKQKSNMKYRLRIAEKVKEDMENLGTSKVTIEPSNKYAQEAYDLLASKTPEILTGITNIRTDLNKDVFGEYSSDSEHTVFLNMKKIENEVRSKLSGQSEDDIKAEIIRQTALVISHEDGHLHAYTERKDSSEFPAEQQEQEVAEKLK